MPTTPYATLLASVAAGAPTAGGLTAIAGQTVQLSGESTVGWTAQKYEIYSYPTGFAAPAGWSTDAAGVYFYSTSSTPPLITLSAATTPAKYLFRLTVNNGLDSSGVAAATLVDEATAVRVAGIGGLHAFAPGESSQWSASKKWAGDLQADLVILDTSLAALPVAAAPTVTVKSEATAAAAGAAATVLRTDAQIQAATGAPVAIGTANAQGAASTLARSNHVHDHGAQTVDTHHALAVAGVSHGFLDKADKAILDGATATPTASKIAKWGASVDLGAAYFYTAGTVATSGLFRTANNQIGAAARNAANGANLSVWKYTSADRLELGDSANAAGVRVQALGSGANAVVLAMGGASADAVTVGLKGVGLFGALSGATAGDGVLTWNVAATAPTGAPTGTAVDAWVSAASGWQARTGKALTVTLAPVTTSAATDQRLDKIHATVHTSDASVTQIASYTLPAACCFVARFFVTGQQTGTDACAVYSFEVTAVRAAGSATVTTGTVTTLVDTIGVAGVPSAVASTNDVSFRVQGKAGPTQIDWCLSAVHVHLYAV